LIGFAAIAGVLVAVQYFLVFPLARRGWRRIDCAGIGAWAAARSSSAALAAAMRHEPAVMSTESTLLYREIG
jgi:hypothetical protein